MQLSTTRTGRAPVGRRPVALWLLLGAAWVCHAQPAPEVALRVDEEQVWLEVEQVPLVSVLEALAAELGFELHTAGALDRPITARSDGERPEPLLRRITRPDSMVIEYAKAADGSRRLAKVRVYERGEAQLPATGASPAGSVDALERMLTDGPAVQQRVDAARKLGALGTEEARDALVAGLEDDDARVRRQVVDAIAKFGDEIAVPLLGQAALGDDSASIRAHAIRRLAAIGGETAREIVEAAADDDNPNVSAEATQRLERWP